MAYKPLNSNYKPLNSNSIFYLTKVENSQGRGSYLSAMSFAPKNLSTNRTKKSQQVIEE